MGRKVVWPPTVILHRPSGQARAKFGGRYVYLGPYGSQEAREKYLRLITAHATGTPTKAPGTTATVLELVAAWQAHAETEYSERGHEAEQFRIALVPFLRLFGSRPAAGIGTGELELYQSALAAGTWMTDAERADPRRRKVMGYCRNVVNARVNRVRRVWRWAEEHGLVPPGSWGHLRTLRPVAATSKRARKTREVRPVEVTELLKVLRHCRHRSVRAILRVMYYTGMRTGEACRMRACEIDRTGDVWLYRPTEHKCEHLDQPRVIGLGPRCRRVLGPWLAAATSPEAYLFPPARKRGRGHYVAYTLAARVRQAARAAGVVGLHAYQIRHLFRRRMTREMNLDHARAAMGHKSLGTTAGYAAEVDLKMLKDVARRLG